MAKMKGLGFRESAAPPSLPSPPPRWVLVNGEDEDFEAELVENHDARAEVSVLSRSLDPKLTDDSKKEKELAARQADLNQREREIKGREDAVATGIYVEWGCSGSVKSVFKAWEQRLNSSEGHLKSNEGDPEFIVFISFTSILDIEQDM